MHLFHLLYVQNLCINKYFCVIYAALSAAFSLNIYSKVVHRYQETIQQEQCRHRLYNLQIAFNLSMTHMSCLLFQLTKIWKLDTSHETILLMLQNGWQFHVLHRKCTAAAHFWHMTGAVGAARMHGWCISAMPLPHCWPLSHHRLHPALCILVGLHICCSCRLY